MKNDVTWRRIYLFVGITFVVTYGLEFFLFGNLIKNQEYAPYLTPMVASMMFIPALVALIISAITKEGFSGIYLKADFKNTKRFYVLAWFGPSVLILLGAVLYFLLFPAHFDKNLSYMLDIYQKAGVTLTSKQLYASLFSQFLMGLFAGPILNILNALGEELGWRGYLLPKLLSKFKVLPALLISGIIWGLWHAPLIALIGHNYGFNYPSYPIGGILAMCVFCIVLGIFLSYLTIRTRSCLAAAFAHGGLNAMASISVFFLAKDVIPNPFIGPTPVGIIGGMGFVIMAVVLLLILLKEEKTKLNLAATNNK